MPAMQPAVHKFDRDKQRKYVKKEAHRKMIGFWAVRFLCVRLELWAKLNLGSQYFIAPGASQVVSGCKPVISL